MSSDKAAPPRLMVAVTEDTQVWLVCTGEEKGIGCWRGKWVATCRNVRIAEMLCDLWNGDPIREPKEQHEYDGPFDKRLEAAP